MEVKIGFLFVSMIQMQEALSKALYHFIGRIIIVKIREIPVTTNLHHGSGQSILQGTLDVG